MTRNAAFPRAAVAAAAFIVVASLGGEARALPNWSKDLLKEVPDVPALCRTGKITIKGDDAFIEGVTTPGQKRGDLVRVGGQWKMLVEAPETDEQKKEAQMVPKLAAALATVSADLDAGKYATIQDFANALTQAIQSVGGG